ncbi:hypothetical protein [Flavobacterium sp.]|uniref:hypothetical protein n=1 Tax=Flavobacterium sp. TaxID=239 RepID=UPI0037524CD5
MKFPFTIIKKYKTLKTKDDIYDIINSQGNEKLLYGLRVDKFYSEFKNNEFKIYRESFGVDAFLENYPLITSRILNENPTKLEVEIKPNYFNIIFFGIFVIVFISGSIFLNEIEINGVLKNPNLLERFLFSLGGIIPGIWCYISFIRPIYKTEKWFVEKLNLKEI